MLWLYLPHHPCHPSGETETLAREKHLTESIVAVFGVRYTNKNSSKITKREFALLHNHDSMKHDPNSFEKTELV